MKVCWTDRTQETKDKVRARESKSTIVVKLSRLLKLYFIGDGYFEGRGDEKVKEYFQELLGLELKSICAVDEYIYFFL